MIEASDIEGAEKVLVVVAERGLEHQYPAADINPEAVNAFVKHHMSRMRAAIPDMDPRIEAGFNTYFRHALLVGSLCGRADQSRSGGGDVRGAGDD